MNKNKKLLMICIAIPLLVGALAGLISRSSIDVYSAMEKPALSPPGIVFPIVWTILYFLMGLSSYLVITSDKGILQIKEAISAYINQLLVNFVWPIIFFNFEMYFLSFIWIVFLDVLVIKMLIHFFQVKKEAAYLNIPYMIWLLYATYLNFLICYN